MTGLQRLTQASACAGICAGWLVARLSIDERRPGWACAAGALIGCCSTILVVTSALAP